MNSMTSHSLGGAHPGEGTEWCSVHLDHPGGSSSYSDQPQWGGGQGDLGEEDRLPPVCDRFRGRPRQCLEISLPLL